MSGNHPFQIVHLVFDREVQAHLHHLLAAHLESIGIMPCLYLGESLLGTLVEFQFHHIDGVGSLHRDVDSPFSRVLLHNNIVVSKQGKDDIKHLLVMPLVIGVVTIWNGFQEISQHLQGFIHFTTINIGRNVSYHNPTRIYSRSKVARQQTVEQSHLNLLVRKAGEVIAAVSGTWNANLISEMWGCDYAAVKLPSFNVNGTDLQMYSFAGYKMVGVKSTAGNKEWALKVAEWLSDEKSQLMICKAKGECPVNLNAASNPLVKKSPAIAAMAEQTKYSSTQRIGVGYWNPSLLLGVVLSDGKNLSDKEIQNQLDITVRDIRN